MCRVAGRDAGAAGAQRRDQVDLVMRLPRRRRIGEIRPVRQDRVRGLGAEERRLAVGAAAHLPGMAGVVAADAEDAAHRKGGAGAG